MALDHRRFLGQRLTLVALWLEGPAVDLPGRRVRCKAPPAEPGWYRVTVAGRVATVEARAEAPDLSALPAVRGPFLRLRGQPGLVGEGGRVVPLSLLPEEEPPALAPVVGRRWGPELVLFDGLDFEGEAEGAARRALEEGGSLAGVAAVSARLRTAFSLLELERASRRLGIPVTPAEARPALAELAEGGPASAEALLRRLEAERQQVAEELRALGAARAAAAHREAVADARRRRGEAPPERLEAALEAAGARLLSARRLSANLTEVVFSLEGERFVCVVHPATLQVLDAGVCLGHPPADEELTLESLPGVIREAIDTGQLVVTRHA